MKRRVLAVSLCFLAAGCLGPAARRGLPPPPPPSEGGPAEVPPAVSTGPAATALWAVPAGQDPLAAAEFLSARPQLRLTLLFPEWFFNEEEAAKKAKVLFAEMAARGQIEVLLTLPQRPVLPLIHDTDAAKLSTMTASLPLPPRFRRPEDAAGQMALAKSAYKRRWRTSPTGFAVPWGAVAGPELETVSRMGFRWLYLGVKGEPGVCGAGDLPAVVARPVPASLKGEEARKGWLRRASSAENGAPPVQVGALEDLSALAALPGLRWITVGESLKDPPRDAKACAPADLSPWIGEPEENRAWQLLGMARQAVEDFKNSGRADVQTLDRATREVYGAENGSVFLALGNEGSSARAGEVKREFLASLEQVYRFLGAPPPPALRQGFSGNGASGGDAADVPFFRREGAALRWRDGEKDDRGPGDFYYPTGTGFPPGAWDLISFKVEPRAGEVTFRWTLAALANPGGAPAGFSLELVDTYIDINHLPGAGEERLLPGRPGLVEPQNAWEYALSVDGWGARLYQQGPGGAPRRMATLPVKVVPPSTVEVSVPLRYLRGDSSNWGFAVAVMGRAPSSPEAGEPEPMAVQEQPGPDHFGGAAKGLSAPPYLDLLSEGPEQNEALSAYKQGREPALPFVRADE